MRHLLLALIAAAGLACAVRIRMLLSAGLELHSLEVAARARCESILRAEEQRRLAPPAKARFAPHEFLSALIDEGRLADFERVEGGGRELYRCGGYLFHVRLKNRLGRPIAAPPAAPEPGIGLDFELWAWPADPEETTAALFYGSQAGFLIQGDNGRFGGVEACPEEGAAQNPLRQIDAAPNESSDRWVKVASIRGG